MSPPSSRSKNKPSKEDVANLLSAGKVVLMKSNRDEHVLNSAEKGETVTVTACCNDEGNILYFEQRQKKKG
jgi:hypothetical protein